MARRFSTYPSSSSLLAKIFLRLACAPESHATPQRRIGSCESSTGDGVSVQRRRRCLFAAPKSSNATLELRIAYVICTKYGARRVPLCTAMHRNAMRRKVASEPLARFLASSAFAARYDIWLRLCRAMQVSVQACATPPLRCGSCQGTVASVNTGRHKHRGS